MNASQLEVEYKGMEDRHELYAKFGIAAEAAQLFETDLGTLLLCLKALDNGWHLVPDGEAALEALNQIDGSTLGRMLHNLKRYIKIERDLDDVFMSALVARNQLSHGFFERHNFKIQTEYGRKEMISELEGLHRELYLAWRSASELLTIVTEVVRRGGERITDELDP